MLTGESKKIYQRNYMRERRAIDVRPLKKSLALVDQTLDESVRRLKNTNKNLEEVIKMVTNNPINPNEAEYVEEDTPAIKDDQTITLNTSEPSPSAGEEPLPAETATIQSTKATKYCGNCHGRGFVELDTIGLMVGPCPVCRGKTEP